MMNQYTTEDYEGVRGLALQLIEMKMTGVLPDIPEYLANCAVAHMIGSTDNPDIQVMLDGMAPWLDRYDAEALFNDLLQFTNESIDEF